MKPNGRHIVWCLLCILAGAGRTEALDRPWVSDVFFYWYTWDYDQQLGGWMGGVHNTPLDGYYDSRSYKDNRQSLWLASEWGITHHFIDYWSPTWKGEGDEMREKIVFRAAEDVRKAGYNLWMSYYQDGYNFAMDDFSKNFTEKRDVYQWVRDFASSPVWPKIGDKPMQLVYSNSGAPKTTIDHAGFRSYLRKRYSTTEALNREWGTSFPSFEAIEMDFGATGWQRAWSIRYQYELWRQSWEKLDSLVQKEFGYPGIKASFDIAYQPFMGFSYGLMDKVFCGPHSYGGIFSQPEDQDVQRFIQAVVAKHYNTVFLDHFKQFYHDWNIRIPGTSYRPDPCHFDRFWTGVFTRYAEGLLHLSWNEWWEGSNLEPNWEFGKTYCEKNLFYSTLMQLAFPSIRDFGKKAKICVLLNDWSFQMGGTQSEELYQLLQSLRKLNVDFDLLPDDFVTDQALSRFQVVIAPGCGTGFGFNDKEERIGEVLKRWTETGSGKHLVVSRDADMRKWLGLREATTASGRAATLGPDGNVFVDIGEQGDEKALIAGSSGRENWGNLPPGAFGAGSGLTVRWTPASGSTTSFLLPASPNRDHVFRFQGSAIWDNTVRLIVNGAECGRASIKPGVSEYEIPVPASAIGGNGSVELRLKYDLARIPMKEDPEKFTSEARVCNVALDWIQWSTSNTPARSTKTTLTLPADKVEFLPTSPRDIKGKTVKIEWSPRDLLDDSGDEVLSRYTRDRTPRDLRVRKGQNEVLYVNGSFTNFPGDEYWTAFLSGWSQPPMKTVTGKDVIGTTLEAGNTVFSFAAHHNIAKPTEVNLQIPKRQFPLSEAAVLSLDGSTYQRLPVTVKGDRLVAINRMQYYGVCQFAFAPVRVETPSLVIHPGESATVSVKVTNITEDSARGDVRFQSVIPTIGSTTVAFTLPPRQSATVSVTLTARSEIDWGQKTVALVVTVGGQPTYFLRPLRVERNPDLRLASHIIDASRPVLRVTNKPHPYCVNATAKEVVASLDGQRTRPTEIASGRMVDQPVSLLSSSAGNTRRTVPSMEAKKVTLNFTGSGQSWEKEEKAWLASVPSEFPRHKDAVQPVVVFNPSDRYLENETVSVEVKGADRNLFLLDSRGTPVPSQIEGRTVWFLVMVPPHEGRTYFLCKGAPPEVSTDLTLKTDDDTGDTTLSNLALSMTLAPKQGGTATHLFSRTTGLDYGQQSFGVNYGKFNSYDPTNPAVQTTQFIDEHKTRQSDTPATIRVLSRGPVRCVVQVEWKDRNVQTTQTYEFRAYQPYFRIATRVTVQGGLNRLVNTVTGNEMVVLDARFKPNRLTKSFPNFVGMVDDQEHSHFGWREGRWVPPYLTLMSPDTFEESVSLIVETHKGLNLVRQGFWPANRPNPGRCESAELELVCSPPWPGAKPIQKSAEAQCIVLFHSKHQVVAQAFREALQEPPLVVTPEKFSWSGELKTTIADVPRDWLSTFWHHRALVEVPGAIAASEEPLSATLDVSKLKGDSIDPNSIRVVEVDSAGRALALPIFVFDQDKGVVSWLPPKTEKLREQRRFHLYFDSTANGPKPLPRSVTFFPVNALHDQSFENEGERVGWSLSGSAVLEEGGAHAGQRCVRLSDASGDAPALLANNSIRVRPKTAYRVTYWAKTLKGSPDVRVNFFNGPAFDFEQVPYGVPPDGKWHRFECTLSGHDFPPGTPLAFRIWTLSGNCAVLIDDVDVAPVGSSPQSATNVTMLRVESLDAP